MSFLFNEDERETYKEETRDINVTISGIVTGISGGGHSEETVLSIPMAKACRDKIVGSIKNLKIELYKTIDDEVVEQIYEDGRLTLLNDRPNMTATASDLKEKMVSDLILHGNSYTSIERKSDSNKILELWNLEPSDVTIHPYRNRIKPYIVDDIPNTVHQSYYPKRSARESNRALQSARPPALSPPDPQNLCRTAGWSRRWWGAVRKSFFQLWISRSRFPR